MADDWMPAQRLRLSLDEFGRLPRNAAYKYEYIDGTVWLNPRPRFYHALLALPATFDAAADVAVRPFGSADWEATAPVFAAAFHHHQPFASLSDEERRQAARKALERTRDGGDGPWVRQASLVACDDEDGTLLGAALVTLLPRRDPTDWDTYSWEEPPPADCVEQRLGRPHLTWIFVRPHEVGHGVGTALLAAVADALVRLGYDELLSTFLLGNESSMLWHWRTGFRLLMYPGSARRRLW